MERLHPIGKIVPKSAAEVKTSRLGIGFEKLDRDVFDPENAYDPVGKIGVKWARIQSGWQRTEKQKGVYDFAWIDSIVDNLIARGMQPWVCLCYGNGLYDELARQVFGAVGVPPIYTEEQRSAWDAYVEATVSHFAGRVTWWEIWNEPDGDWCWKRGHSGIEYGQFAVATAKAIRRADPSAKIMGGCVCGSGMRFLTEAMEQGMGQVVDAVTFHEYTADETRVEERVRSMRALCDMYAPGLEIIQGESGSQSRSGGNGALRNGAWTPVKQAKQLLRHAVADLRANVKFTSYFSCMDMQEALNGTTGDIASILDFGYFGVLGAEFDENGRASGTYTPKPSYYALQNLGSLLAEEFTVADLPVITMPRESPREFGFDVPYRSLLTCGFTRKHSRAYAYWAPTDLMTVSFESTVTLQFAALPVPRLADPMDGTVYEIPESMIVRDGEYAFHLVNLPVRDYPMFLLFGDWENDTNA